MSIIDANGGIHDPGTGQFSGHVQGEGDAAWLAAAPPVPAGPIELFDGLDAPTRMRLRTASVTLPAALLTQVTRAIQAEGFPVQVRPQDSVRALDYAQFAFDHRHLVGLVPGWGTEQYLEMTRPWREDVGEIHPDDAGGRPWYDDVLGQIPDEDDITAEERWGEALDAARADAAVQLGSYLPADAAAPF